MAATGPPAKATMAASGRRLGRRRRLLAAVLLLALPVASLADANQNETVLTDSSEPTSTSAKPTTTVFVAAAQEDPSGKRRHCTPKHDKHGVWNGSTEPGGEYVLTCDHGYAVDKQRSVTLTCSEDEVQWNADPWCENMDDCAERMYGCGPAGLCVDHVGHSECICERGAFTKNMNNGEQVCYFKNETKHCGGRNCGAHGICVDLTQYQQSFDTGDSSFRCSCERGFEDDGSTCKPVDCGERYDSMGTWSGSSTYLGEYTLECKEGAFVLGGSQQAITVTCPADGRWESERMFNITPPKCLSPTQAARDARNASLRFWTNIVMSLCCICGAACAAGLTMGLLSLEPREMEIIQRARLNDCLDDSEREKLERQKDAARHILPLIKDHHLLLVTLLLLNALANEALPIFLDQLVSPFIAVLMSVTFVLMCGEILPSAVFTGPLQLTIASMFIPCVKFLLCGLYPIAKPIAVALDHGLPHKSAEEELYSRPEIRAVLSLHTHGPAGDVSRTAASTRPNSGSSSQRHLVGEEALVDQEAPTVDAPLDPLESQICFGILDLGEMPVVECVGFRSLRRCSNSFHAVLQSTKANAAALAAAKAGMEGVVVFKSLELVKWPIEVPLEALRGVLRLPELLTAPPGATVGELCPGGQGVPQLEADDTVTNALSILASTYGTPCSCAAVIQRCEFMGLLDGEEVLDNLLCETPKKQVSSGTLGMSPQALPREAADAVCEALISQQEECGPGALSSVNENVSPMNQDSPFGMKVPPREEEPSLQLPLGRLHGAGAEVSSIAEELDAAASASASGSAAGSAAVKDSQSPAVTPAPPPGPGSSPPGSGSSPPDTGSAPPDTGSADRPDSSQAAAAPSDPAAGASSLTDVSHAAAVPSGAVDAPSTADGQEPPAGVELAAMGDGKAKQEIEAKAEIDAEAGL